MINEVKSFLDNFFQAEIDARNAAMKPDIEDANNKVDKLHSFVTQELQNSFGVIKSSTPLPDFIYKKFENSFISQARHLYKISEYKNPTYGSLYFSYVSNYNPPSTVFILFQCFVVGRVDGQYKIIMTALVDKDSNPPTWSVTGDEKEFSFDSPGELIKVERYLEPKDDSYSMEIYKKDV